MNSPQMDRHVECRSYQNLVEIAARLLSKVMWHGKGAKIAKMVLTKNKVRGIGLPDVKTYYIAIVIKTVWYRWRDRHMHVPRLGVELELKQPAAATAPATPDP